ncbi:MAG: DNA-deoxyinosine glycosylase [Planctomycetota bacterium]
MANVASFDYVAQRDARILVLGSMPGVASLEAQRYYAHPRNAFWPIMGELCGFAPDAEYGERLQALRRAGVALWDVLARCRRKGSLDSDIDRATAEANDFAGFYARHPDVRSVFCNGGAAFDLYRRRVVAGLDIPWRGLPVVKLPSTSPAHASQSLAQKRERWLAELRGLLAGG